MRCFQLSVPLLGLDPSPSSEANADDEATNHRQETPNRGEFTRGATNQEQTQNYRKGQAPSHDPTNEDEPTPAEQPFSWPSLQKFGIPSIHAKCAAI